ncbi:UDP-Glycosyltransferase superfamily protein [Euphorbia peplus]|nr:UDP-Glycosyltransferase superfamily protein [Euphorbia peplus]
MEILSHKSMGAFLSHCGWNSVLESLSCGVPIIGWPLATEQFYNAKFLEEMMGVCVEVGRGKVCEVGVEVIVRKIEMVMGSERQVKVSEMRRKACEVREIITEACRDEDGFKGSSFTSIDEFLNAAFSMRKGRDKFMAYKHLFDYSAFGILTFVVYSIDVVTFDSCSIRSENIGVRFKFR